MLIDDLAVDTLFCLDDIRDVDRFRANISEFFFV
jgi:hypothetical protein